MSDGKLGLPGAVAIGLGGMIGGGVFSVLGVVVTIAGAASWLAFTAASLVSLCAAYSYVRLNELNDRTGGSVTHIESFLGNDTVAGMVGWTLLFGYVGAIAMYAFAFGGFAARLVPTLGLGLPRRALFSLLAVALFVALNVLGARATGTSEEVLVGLKVLILLGIGGAGLRFGFRTDQLAFGLGNVTDLGLVTATAVSFVSFQGWQLLVYDYESIENAATNVPRAIYVSIAGAIVVDGVIAVLVTSLVRASVIQAHPEIAVARAVEPFLGSVGFTVVAVAALFSTGSAINGTLFSAAHFTKRMLTDGLVPDRLGEADASGAPAKTVLVLGALAAAFTVFGSLEGITSFGSLAFMVVFGTMSYLAFRERDAESVNPVVPAVGVLGTAAFIPLLLAHLHTAEPDVFTTVVVLSVGVIGVEVVYFERETVADGVREVRKRV